MDLSLHNDRRNHPSIYDANRPGLRNDGVIKKKRKRKKKRGKKKRVEACSKATKRNATLSSSFPFVSYLVPYGAATTQGTRLVTSEERVGEIEPTQGTTSKLLCRRGEIINNTRRIIGVARMASWPSNARRNVVDKLILPARTAQAPRNAKLDE